MSSKDLRQIRRYHNTREGVTEDAMKREDEQMWDTFCYVAWIVLGVASLVIVVMEFV